MRPFSLFHVRRFAVAPALVSLGLAIASLTAPPIASAASTPPPTLTLIMTGWRNVASGGKLIYEIGMTDPQVPVKVCEPGWNGKPSCVWDSVPGQINSIVVTNTLPSGVVVKDLFATNSFVCALSGSQIICTGGSLPVGGNAQIYIEATAPTLAPGAPSVLLTDTVTAFALATPNSSSKNWSVDLSKCATRACGRKT